MLIMLFGQPVDCNTTFNMRFPSVWLKLRHWLRWRIKLLNTHLSYRGVLDNTEVIINREELLATLSVLDVWGVGSRWGKILEET